MKNALAEHKCLKTEFEMMNLGNLHYFLGIEVWHLHVTTKVFNRNLEDLWDDLLQVEVDSNEVELQAIPRRPFNDG